LPDLLYYCNAVAAGDLCASFSPFGYSTVSLDAVGSWFGPMVLLFLLLLAGCCSSKKKLSLLVHLCKQATFLSKFALL
ncbi:hypothetical protein Dimus_030328, partial [Dionaea muscipula]